jgi:hypothetical protein
MFKSQNAKRFRAVFIALAITFATNYAITYASGTGDQSQSSIGVSAQTSVRSGDLSTPKPPRP